jgi:NadR type nicotinamide-nucleotide adenylyltransferase
VAPIDVRDRGSPRGLGALKAVRGLILGKFLPPHAGHLHLIRTAAALCDELTVLVCTVEREPIPGALRAEWMRELACEIGSHIRIVHVDEEVPQSPEEHPIFWPIWDSLCGRYAGSIDVVFTSEDYGDELARVLGARHHPVDPMRHTFPVSGTAIRDDAFGSWEMIPPPVRAHYAGRVALVGPESTGKTSLAQRLAAAFDTVWVPEYGREHTDAITAREGVPFGAAFTEADIETIATVQAEREDSAARLANRVLFCDTELLTTRIWSEIYFDHCPADVVIASETREYDLYLLLDIDIPWVDDGTRTFRAERQTHFDRIRSALDRLDRRYVIIGGSFDERLDRAIAAVISRWPELGPVDDA